MSLEILWFVLIAVLWTGFFFLEGFDFGVGILQYFLGRNERERGTYISSIAPHWDGNEVWLLTACGAIFAAFPFWYAAFFSALYLPLVVLLLALVVRGACFEIRHRVRVQKYRAICDLSLAVSSFLSALLICIVIADFAVGIPIDSNGNYDGSFFELFKPLTLFCGLMGISLFLTNGALFLTLKIEGELRDRAYRFLRIAVRVSMILVIITTVSAWKNGIISAAAPVFIIVAAVMVQKHHLKTAFVFVSLCIAFSVVALFFAMFPNVLVSSITPENNLTIWNAASSDYTLKVISIVSAVFVPVVLAYQIWSYYVFRKRISPINATIEV